MIRLGALQQMMLDAISGDNDDEILEGEWTQRWFHELKDNFPLLFDIWCISFEYSVSQLVLSFFNNRMVTIGHSADGHY